MPLRMLSKTSPARSTLQVAFPKQDYPVGQDAEWCVVCDGAGWKEVRFHDYSRIFEVPGLYEKIFLEHLGCRSHVVVAEALNQALLERRQHLADKRILDLGAGNGHVSARLHALGARFLAGVDALPAARDAAHRDHPGLYQEYRLSGPGLEHDMHRLGIDTLICVAALGFDDVSPDLFEHALSALAPGSLVAFNIKEQFLNNLDPSGFNHLFDRLQRTRKLKPLKQWRHFHRYSTWGEEIYYAGVVAEVG